MNRYSHMADALLTKLSGVGFDVHGYHTAPEKMGYDPEDYWEAMDAARVKTPHDQHSNYKYNLTAASHGVRKYKGDPLFEHTTDQMYADENNKTDRRLSKSQFKNVLGAWKQRSEQYLSSLPHDERPQQQRYHDAFINKSEHLLASPKVKFIRMEFE